MLGDEQFARRMARAGRRREVPRERGLRPVEVSRLEEDGEIWDENGTLLALSRQLAALPR